MVKVINEDLLKRVDEDRSILNGIWQRKHRWIAGFAGFCQKVEKTGFFHGKKTEFFSMEKTGPAKIVFASKK